jgi:hypothetical protein
VVIVFAFLSQSLAPPAPESVPSTSPPARVHRLPQIAQSARNSYPLADQAARSWQEDARLVSASTSWPWAQLDDLSRPVDWTFQFFSPGTHRLYAVVVGESQVLPIREALSPYALPSLSEDEWRIDSHQALGTWLDDGGSIFMSRHPIVDISARLRRSEEGRPEWVVVGIVKDSLIVHVVRVDARNGRVIR